MGCSSVLTDFAYKHSELQFSFRLTQFTVVFKPVESAWPGLKLDFTDTTFVALANPLTALFITCKMGIMVELWGLHEWIDVNPLVQWLANCECTIHNNYYYVYFFLAAIFAFILCP